MHEQLADNFLNQASDSQRHFQAGSTGATEVVSSGPLFNRWQLLLHQTLFEILHRSFAKP